MQIGLTGLAAVLLVVGAAGVLTRSASKERPVEMPANAAPAIDNADANEEPLVDLGVAPSTDPTNQAAPAGQ